MAFINEKLTEEQREDFRAKGIKDPNIGSVRFIAPLYQTIDREKDMCLVHAGVQRDACYEHYFVFFWKGKQHMISLIMDTEPNTIIWKNEVELSPYVFSADDPFVSDLKEALKVRKFWGEPEEMDDDSKVIFKF